MNAAGQGRGSGCRDVGKAARELQRADHRKPITESWEGATEKAGVGIEPAYTALQAGRYLLRASDLHLFFSKSATCDIW